MSVCLRLVCCLWMATSALPLPTFALAQEMTFTLNEQLIIGDDEDAPAEYLFTRPRIVRTDSKGYVVLARKIATGSDRGDFGRFLLLL